jgi:PAS domain-containing protein
LSAPARSVRHFPSDDAAFGDFVRAWASAPAIAAPEDLQRALRTRYPAAVVRVQSEFGRLGPPTETWYAFRYGVRDAADERAAAVTPGAAWAIIDDDRRFVAVSQELAAIMEIGVEELAGRSLEDFGSAADPTVAEDLRAMWVELTASGRLTSTIRYNYLDGRPRELGFDIVLNGAGPGRHRLTVVVVSG